MTTYSQNHILRGRPDLTAMLDYLKVHGPSTSAQMRRDGLEVSRKMIRELHLRGMIVRGSERGPKGEYVWSL